MRMRLLIIAGVIILIIIIVVPIVKAVKKVRKKAVFFKRKEREGSADHVDQLVYSDSIFTFKD
jgi:hypothetical protein